VKPLRFLMVCMQYPVGAGESYMTTELADALVAAGHEVEVLLLDWAAEPGGQVETVYSPSDVRIVRCPPHAVTAFGGLVGAASKFVLSGRRATRVARRRFDLRSFDAAIAWMPAVAIAPLLPLLRRAGVRHRLLFIWDFFPDHHREIGRVPSGLPYRLARGWERRLLRHFTAILCTLPGNAAYLRRHYPVSAAQKVLVTPIWSDTTPRPPGDRRAIRTRHGLPIDRPIAIFGGQLVEGRGFEQMLAAAEAGLAAGSSLLFLFIGDGRLAPMLREQAARRSNIRHLPALPREDYLELLGACDVGMVATVPGVTSYSIPTKTIDYLRAGLPVIAAVEEGSDFVAILDRYRVGRAVPFGAPHPFFREAERLATDPVLRAEARAGAPHCLDEVFDVRHAVTAVLSVAGRTPA
jgi:hypothetical protein